MDFEHFRTFQTDDFLLDKDFWKLVRRPDSDRLIDELIERLPEKRYEIRMAVQVIQGLHIAKYHQPVQRKKELWQQVVKKKKKDTRLVFFKYAALFLLLIFSGSSLFYFLSKEPDTDVLSFSVPNSNNAMLILASGDTVSISSKQSSIKCLPNGSGVNVNDSSNVVQSDRCAGYNKMIVPYGKRSVVTLSDGTRVRLNSGSTLFFPSIFKGKTREVYLIGEAFFDVTHMKEKPFYVRTDAFKMKVYGTKFDVRAYQQDCKYNIVLVEGKVSMQSNKDKKSKEVFLAPKQKASICKGGKDFEISNVENIDAYTSWMYGYLTFKDVDVREVLEQVARYYNVDIEPKLPDNIENISGKLDLKDDLDKVLNGIAFISKTHYKKSGENYVFYE